MVTNTKCTTDMYRFMTQKIDESVFDDILVFKDDDKNPHYKGKYIAINCLPFSYGQPVNRLNAMNINLHCPRLSDGTADRKNLDKMLEFVASLIPEESPIEDDNALFLNGVYYCIHHQTRPLEDKDDTFFINVRLSLTF